MPRHDDRVALRHMRDHAAEAVGFVKGRTRTDLEADRLLGLGLTRLVEIVGEAAGRVSKPVRDAHPRIPWSQIIGTRNRLVHGYDQVDYDVLWTIVSDELHVLIGELDRILGSQFEEKP